MRIVRVVMRRPTKTQVRMSDIASDGYGHCDGFSQLGVYDVSLSARHTLHSQSLSLGFAFHFSRNIHNLRRSKESCLDASSQPNR